MPRRRTPKKMVLTPDPSYENLLIQMLVNQLMKKGKKPLAYRICYQALKQLGEITQEDPVFIVEQAVRNATPLVEVKAKRRGGATYQVPVPVPPNRGTALAIRWLLNSSRNRSGRTMTSKLTNELLDASKNLGNAIRKRDEMNRMAEANKAFASNRF
jgi:small subunit ribosomal protein S7